jgi:membrane protease subunit (stomatin/prohibitin family)
MVPLAASGRYGLKVEDAERFLTQLVGTLLNFSASDLTNHFLGALVAKTKSVVIAFMQTNQVGITTISARLDDLSRFLAEPLKEFWESYGMLLSGFYITSVDLDTSSEDGRKIAAALSDRSAQNIAGYTWQQKQGFGVAKNALSGGGDIGFLGVAAMSGMLGGGAQAMMQAPQQAPAMAPPAGRKEVFCAKCAKKYPATSNFCPFCGNRYNPCPRCGSDNLAGSKRCVSCGTELVAGPAGGAFGNACPRCGQQVAPGVKFCPNCGSKV